MKIYLAAPWISREDAKVAAAKFVKAGHTITHKWWEMEGEYSDHPKMLQCALADIDGVSACDALVVLNTAVSEGKAVEQGLAIAWGKPIYAVGVRGEASKNIFHHLGVYEWFPTVEDVIAAFNQ